MKQLCVFCEGRTEQRFAAQVLQPHLFPSGDGIIHTLAVGERDFHHVYGLGRRTKYERVRRFIINTIKQRGGANVYFTSLFDLYGLPADFPGKTENVRDAANPTPYVKAIEDAFGRDINYRRFLPYLQLHEFETILFSEPDGFAISFDDCDDAIQELKKMAVSVPSVEHIDDGESTAPSKRILQVIPAYEGLKSTAGADIAEYIGVPRIREKCHHFDEWLSMLENIVWE